MLEKHKLYYFPGNKIMMRDLNGNEIDVTNGFPHEEYKFMKESEKTTYAANLENKGSEF